MLFKIAGKASMGSMQNKQISVLSMYSMNLYRELKAHIYLQIELGVHSSETKQFLFKFIYMCVYVYNVHLQLD